MKKVICWDPPQRFDQRMKMSKEEVVKLMLASFNNDNRMMATGAGMAEDQINELEAKSAQSLEFMLSNVYDLLVQKELLK